jgi:hypothetical protein
VNKAAEGISRGECTRRSKRKRSAEVVQFRWNFASAQAGASEARRGSRLSCLRMSTRRSITAGPKMSARRAARNDGRHGAPDAPSPLAPASMTRSTARVDGRPPRLTERDRKRTTASKRAIDAASVREITLQWPSSGDRRPVASSRRWARAGAAGSAPEPTLLAYPGPPPAFR